MPPELWSLPLDSSHPGAHGGLRLLLELDGTTITAAQPAPGALHRGAEKLFESRDYRSLLALADRHDWLGSLGSETGLAELIERMLGIRVPQRASWLRMMLQEAARISHHLLWLAATAEHLEAHVDAVAAGHRARAELLDVIETYTGFRLHHMIVQPGGLRTDCPAEWPRRVAETATRCVPVATQLGGVLNEVTPAHLAVIPPAEARARATSGPMARASGIPRDVRATTDDPAYTWLRDHGIFTIITATDGDARSRFAILARQVAVSAACLTSAAEFLGESGSSSEIATSLPRSIRVPEGSAYGESENPSGVNGWYLVSRGGPNPYRLFLRTASTNNAQALAAALPGTDLSDLPLALMSGFLLAGDVDK